VGLEFEVGDEFRDLVGGCEVNGDFGFDDLVGDGMRIEIVGKVGFEVIVEVEGKVEVHDVAPLLIDPVLMNAALMISHNNATQKRLSNAIAEMQSDPATTYKDLCEVLSDHISNEIRSGYQMA